MRPQTSSIARCAGGRAWAGRRDGGCGRQERWKPAPTHCAAVSLRSTVLCALQGMGDVLLTYENEAIFTNLVVKEKERLPYIVPDNNIRVGGWVGDPGCAPAPDWWANRGACANPASSLGTLSCSILAHTRVRTPVPPPPQIQCPLALVDHNLRDAPLEQREAASAFCRYLYTKEAQREFAACGFRWGEGGADGLARRAEGSCFLAAGCVLAEVVPTPAPVLSRLACCRAAHCTAARLRSATTLTPPPAFPAPPAQDALQGSV